MKLKPILFSSILAGSGVAFGVIAEDSFDYAKINQNIHAALADVVQNYDKVKAFTYGLIADETDVDRDYYAADMKLAIERDKGKAVLEIDGTVQFALEREGKSEAVSIGVDAKFPVSPIEVTQAFAEKLVCPVADDLAGVKRIRKEEDCKIVGELSSVATVDELQAIIEKHVADLKSALSGFATQSSEDLSALTNVAAQKVLEAEIEKAEKLTDWLETVQITETEDGFQFTAGVYESSNKLTVESLTVTVTSDSFEVAVEAKTSHGIKFYKAFKPELVKLLRDLQADEKYAIELVKMDGRFWLNLLTLHMQAVND